ncbi:signal peptidase II [Persicimonas caeni]|uniref:Lipoprotein signal peptidase n=1 Tax=Persicimonas caeni TaxID=2292766 RepID=A0A4Y6PW44_PERCE|nr:signal peptidase II [Persicimonas caeni]QDG52546.1 signal peptidase II [Persicimonas caeni]QED33768.1 signal peptidase II [Persicimonas caeni]
MKLGKITIVLFVLLGSVGCDQVTKVAARQHLDGRGTLSYLGDTFRLTYAENHGAFLGMGSSLPEGMRTLIFTGLVAVFLLGLLVWVLRTADISKMAVVAASLVIGGGIGNLIDRVAFNGGVTDFMNMGIGSLRTGIFNVADVWIMAGVVLLALTPDMWRAPEEPGAASDPDDAEAPADPPETSS